MHVDFRDHLPEQNFLDYALELVAHVDRFNGHVGFPFGCWVNPHECAGPQNAPTAKTLKGIYNSLFILFGNIQAVAPPTLDQQFAPLTTALALRSPVNTRANEMAQRLHIPEKHDGTCHFIFMNIRKALSQRLAGAVP
ncbi:hypothetical protein ACU685_28295 [Pseudomonas sp. LF195]